VSETGDIEGVVKDLDAAADAIRQPGMTEEWLRGILATVFGSGLSTAAFLVGEEKLEWSHDGMEVKIAADRERSIAVLPTTPEMEELATALPKLAGLAGGSAAVKGAQQDGTRAGRVKWRLILTVED
jgi:hypothetical protein